MESLVDDHRIDEDFHELHSGVLSSEYIDGIRREAWCTDWDLELYNRWAG